MKIKQAPESGLNQEVEIVSDKTDSLDPDLSSYVNSFIEDFRKLPPLEKIDLKSPESAKDALKVLDKNMQILRSHIKTARALRGLLENQS